MSNETKQTSDERLTDGSLVVEDDSLQTCPFCKSDACLTYSGEENEPDPHSECWTVVCWNCGASPISDKKDKAFLIKEWNQRLGCYSPFQQMQNLYNSGDY